MATLPNLRLDYREQYDFTDQKAYGGYFGDVSYGCVVWVGPTNTLVTEDEFGPGWYSWVFESDAPPKGPFATMELAAQALESALPAGLPEVA
jgi:hypothetical protein